MSAKSTEKEVSYTVKMFRKYRNMLGELTRKNIKLKYRNSWLGIFWSFLEPLLNMIVLSVVFGNIFGRSSEYIVCYPVWMFTGRMLFDFFRTSTNQAMTSFRRNATIIKKVYVPKYMYPLSSILSSFVNFAITILCFICVWIFFRLTGWQGGGGLTITWYALLCFIPMLIILIFSAGVGLILSVLAVYFKDVEYIWQVCTRLVMYMVPILYPFEKVTNNWTRIIIKINPLYSMIELFRQCVLYGYFMSGKLLLYGSVTAVATLGVGVLLFNKKNDDLVYHL